MAHQESQPVTPLSGGPRKESAPFVANSATGSLRKKKICICPDLQCQTLIRRVFKETDPDHVWRKGGGFTEIKFRDQSKPSEKVEALRRAVVLHLQLDSETAKFKIFYVCNTHWPVAMLEAEGTGHRSTLLTSSEARELDKKCNYNKRFFDNMNCVGTLLKAELTEKSLKSKYVKAPVCRLQEVEEVLDSYSRARKRRVPPVISTTKKVQFMLNDTAGTAASVAAHAAQDGEDIAVHIPAVVASAPIESPDWFPTTESPSRIPTVTSAPIESLKSEQQRISFGELSIC